MSSLADSVFKLVVSKPKSIILVGLLFCVAVATFLPNMVQDTRPNSFLAPDNPALLYREKVREQFGLSDPLIVAIVNEGTQGVFNPGTMSLVQWLTDEISKLPNIDDTRVQSIASEKSITGTSEGMEVSPFFDPVPSSQAEADQVREVILDFPLYVGTLVASDGKTTLIIAELLDEFLTEETYGQITDLISAAPVSGDDQLYVAGEAAISGFLASYIDKDARVLNPIAWLIIMAIFILAFRRLSPALMVNVIIASSVLISLGIMVGAGIPFFMITTALPVILIGISVADTIHIYSQYFQLQIKEPDRDVKELVVEAMRGIWLPVTQTTLTTMAGFLGLYFAAMMPPFEYFGLFAALGVFVAWVYSMLVLPAVIVLTKPSASQQFSENLVRRDTDVFGRAMAIIGWFNLRFPVPILLLWAAIALGGAYSASLLIVDEDPISIFHESEPIYRADKVINAHMAGTNILDIVIETPHAEDLFIPENLQKIEALQSYAGTLAHVGGSISIVDYLKQMNRVLNDGQREAYQLPNNKSLIAQYFLLYSLSSDPTDFEEEIDFNYQTANIRVFVNSGKYQDFKEIVEGLNAYIAKEFNDEGATATLSGRVNLNYHWIRDLGRSHFMGLFLALILVWAITSILFHSVLAGVYALVPVGGSILLVYSAMVLLGINLGIGTSMFAAVAIGLGVDFSIHTLERLRVLYATEKGDIANIYNDFYQTTGRALLLNFLAIACGFGVLISSKVSSLNNFGGILVVAVSTSFLASMTLLPTLIKVFQPSFITSGQSSQSGRLKSTRIVLIIAVVGVAYLFFSPTVTADEVISDPLSADEIVVRVNELEDGEHVSRKISMLMTDRRGQQRERETLNVRKYYGEEMRTVLFYMAPANIRGTGFLIWDYAGADTEDDQWLYLPALRKVRRISASDRGDYFMGTDFTFEDIKQDGKLEQLDYDFTLVGEGEYDGRAVYQLSAVPKTSDIAAELGYSQLQLQIDKENWIVLKMEFWDLKGNALKTLLVQDVRQIQGIWTRHHLTMENHKTGHQTRFQFMDVDYELPVEDRMLSKQALSRGF